eukprot:Clim_evm8s212 gene=Clim_evmTU8s212
MSSSQLAARWRGTFTTARSLMERLKASPTSAGTVRILDCSWHMPNSGRNPAQEFSQKHIPGARFFDQDVVAAPSAEAQPPHMFPTQDQLKSALSSLGVDNDTEIVLYDTVGIFSTPRMWYLLRRCYGFPESRVKILSGGLPAWESEGGETEIGEISPSTTNSGTTGSLQVNALDRSAVRTYSDIADFANLHLRNFQHREMAAGGAGSGPGGYGVAQAGAVHQLVDARAAGRFMGTAPEPRPGLQSGSVPGSVNLPFSDVLTVCGESSLQSITENPEELQEKFTNVDVDLLSPLTATCGSGMTACTIALAAYLAGAPLDRVSVFDGSWTEYAGRQGAPIVIRADPKTS